MPKIFYTCDPEKHTECSKTECYLHGGRCSKTKNAAFAKEPVTIVHVVFDVEPEDAQALAEYKGDNECEQI